MALTVWRISCLERKSKIEQIKGAISEGYYREMGVKISDEAKDVITIMEVRW